MAIKKQELNYRLGKKNSMGQAAMEYIILTGIVLAIIIPLMVVFYNQSEDITLQVKSQQVRKIGEKIIDTAESVSYLGEPSRIQLKVYIPEGINAVSVVDKGIIFTIDTKLGENQVIVPSDVNMSGSIPITPGYHTISIENRDNYIFVSKTS